MTNIFYYFQNFDYKIVHSPGVSPVLASADCLSRLPKSFLAEMMKYCDEHDIPDRIFTLMHLRTTSETETSAPMKLYLRALAQGNEKQIPILEASPPSPIILKFDDYVFDQKDMNIRQEGFKTISNIRAKLNRKSKRLSKSLTLVNDILPVKAFTSANLTKDVMKRVFCALTV